MKQRQARKLLKSMAIFMKNERRVEHFDPPMNFSGLPGYFVTVIGVNDYIADTEYMVKIRKAARI